MSGRFAVLHGVSPKKWLLFGGGVSCMICAGLLLTGWQNMVRENTQLATQLIALQTADSQSEIRLKQLETEWIQARQERTQFQTAVEGALRHLLSAEITRSTPWRQDLLHRVQADDSTVNSPFAILSQHFATKDYVDQQIANLQNQINALASSGGKLTCGGPDLLPPTPRYYASQYSQTGNPSYYPNPFSTDATYISQGWQLVGSYVGKRCEWGQINCQPSYSLVFCRVE